MAIKRFLLPFLCFTIFVPLMNACIKSEPSTREIAVKGSGTSLFVRITGDADQDRVLVGVHGGPGNSSGYMTGLEQLTGDGLTVVLYDQRGAGLSSAPSNGYALDRYVEDLEAVRQAVNAEQIDLFGHSWGGVIALRYAAVHSVKVRSLILMGSGPPRMRDVVAAQIRLGERIIHLQEEGIIPGVLPTVADDLVKAILPAYFSDPNFRMPEALATMPFNQTASDQTYADTGEWDFVSEVNELELPVLLLWGQDDPFGMEMLTATQSALSQAKVDIVLLENCGHYWHECEAEFFSHLRSFLELPAKFD